MFDSTMGLNFFLVVMCYGRIDNVEPLLMSTPTIKYDHVACLTFIYKTPIRVSIKNVSQTNVIFDIAL